MNQPAVTAIRSTFVTRLGWCLVVFFTFSTFVGIVQNIFVNVAISGEEWQQSLSDLAGRGTTPGWLLPFFENFRLLVFLVLVYSALGLVSGVGLLRRREWGRRGTIVMLVITTGISLAGLRWQFHFFDHLRSDFAGKIPPESLEQMNYLNVVATFITLLSVVLYALLLKKLCSLKIVAEFQPSLSDHSDTASA